MFVLSIAVVAAATPFMAASANAAPPPGPVPSDADTTPLVVLSDKSAVDVPVVTLPTAPPAEAAARARAVPGQCTGAWIFLNESLGLFSHARADSTIYGYLTAGYAPCRNLTAGGWYTGCGYSHNGWILIPDMWFNGYPWAGFVISSCTADP